MAKFILLGVIGMCSIHLLHFFLGGGLSIANYHRISKIKEGSIF